MDWIFWDEIVAYRHNFENGPMFNYISVIHMTQVIPVTQNVTANSWKNLWISVLNEFFDILGNKPGFRVF